MYEYVCRNFLASISADAVTDNTKVVISHGKFEFTIRGLSVKSQGFMEIATWIRSEEKSLEKIEKGAASQIVDVFADESRHQ